MIFEKAARLLFSALAMIVVASVPRSHAAPDADSPPGESPPPVHQIDLCVGGLAPFDSELRDAYGVATALTLGYAPRLGAGDTRLILDVGYIHSSGAEFTNDATFEIPKAEYTLYPINIGVRTNFVPSVGGPVALYLGVALQWTPTRWEAPFVGSESTPVLGALVELRPELTLSDRWGVWVRNRISLVSDSDFGNRIADLNSSGSLLEIGASFRPR